MDRLWYAVVGVLAIICYWPWGHRVAVRFRPAWLPIVAIAVAKRMQRMMLTIVLLFVILLGTSDNLVASARLRAAFAISITILDLDCYSSLRWHHTFIMLYCAWAMVLPEGPNRRGVLLVVVLHNFVSSGLSKIWVGGAAWFHPETLMMYLRETSKAYETQYPERLCPWACIEPMLHQDWLTKFLVARPHLCSGLAFGAVVFQVFLMPLTVFAPGLHHISLVCAVLFIFAVAMLFGFNFALHVPCFFIALWPRSHCSIVNASTCFVAVVLGLTTSLGVESWPMNHCALFSYNHKQLCRLMSIAGKRCRFVLRHDSFLRLPDDEVVDDHASECLVSVCVSADPLPSVYHRELVKCVGGLAFGSEADPHDDETAARLDHWVRVTGMFLDGKTLSPFTGIWLHLPITVTSDSPTSVIYTVPAQATTMAPSPLACAALASVGDNAMIAQLSVDQGPVHVQMPGYIMVRMPGSSALSPHRGASDDLPEPLGMNKMSDSFRVAVFRGLLKPPGDKSVPCRFLYNHRGSELFELITQEEEYYPTSCELEVLRNIASVLAKKGFCNIVELGCGSSVKIATILQAFAGQNIRYIPIDISEDALTDCADSIVRIFPSISITPVAGTYEEGLMFLKDRLGDDSKLVLFLGGNIGNFTRSDAAEFLQNLRPCLSPSDRLLLGVDLRKDKAILERAYNDCHGVTAAFTLNILGRMNAELGADFDIAKWKHRAVYLVDEGRVRIDAVAQEKQTVQFPYINDPRRTIVMVNFEDGEGIHIEDSTKYSFSEIDDLAANGDLNVCERWIDSRGFFSESLLGPVSASKA
jgi:L-histidine N-alpha-methyltransferase